MKVVINTCYGGFRLSPEAEQRLGYDIESRHDPKLVQIVEELGEKANGRYAELKIVEIPDGVEYTIEEYDGREHIAEVHRTWW